MPFQKGEGGRPRGALNKNVSEIKALAAKYAPDAIRTLRHLLDNAELEQTRVAAAKELLDRGIGKAVQPHAGEDGEGPIEVRHIVSWQS